jgi:hypothetical protein
LLIASEPLSNASHFSFNLPIHSSHRTRVRCELSSHPAGFKFVISCPSALSLSCYPLLFPLFCSKILEGALSCEPLPSRPSGIPARSILCIQQVEYLSARSLLAFTLVDQNFLRALFSVNLVDFLEPLESRPYLYRRPPLSLSLHLSHSTGQMAPYSHFPILRRRLREKGVTIRFLPLSFRALQRVEYLTVRSYLLASPSLHTLRRPPFVNLRA